MNEFQLNQVDVQNELRCEYALIVYAKDVAATEAAHSANIASGKPPGPPKYKITRQWPVKLNHQVFMQLSFNILKDRLLTASQALKREVSEANKFNAKNQKMRKEEGARIGGRKNDEDEDELEFHPSVALLHHQADLVAMFQFLTHFGSQMQSAADEAANGRGPSRSNSSRQSTATTATSRRGISPVRKGTTSSRGGSTTVKSSLVAKSSGITGGGGGKGASGGGYSSSVSSTNGSLLAPTTTTTSARNQDVLQQVRFQLLLEYGQDPLVLSKTMSQREIQQHLSSTKLIPSEVSEEEFFQQMGRPAGMAQQCSIM